MADAEKLVIEIHTGERVQVTHAQMEVIEALDACHRKGMSDATRREVLEVMSAQLGYEVREHVVSGRFSELVRLEVLEEVPKRDDRFTQAIRAKRGRASKVLAYRRRLAQQGRLALSGGLRAVGVGMAMLDEVGSQVIEGSAALAGGGAVR